MVAANQANDHLHGESLLRPCHGPACRVAVAQVTVRFRNVHASDLVSAVAILVLDFEIKVYFSNADSTNLFVGQRHTPEQFLADFSAFPAGADRRPRRFEVWVDHIGHATDENSSSVSVELNGFVRAGCDIRRRKIATRNQPDDHVSTFARC